MKDKIVLVTGGSSGIGKAVAKDLCQKGAVVIIQARTQEKLQKAAQEIDPTGKRVHYYATNLTDQFSVIESANQIIKEVGLPDIIVNSAGAGEWLTFKESTVSHFKDTMNSPYLATALTCKVFFDKMKARDSGQFIIVNSAGCYFSFPGATGYLPARWAMLGFAKSLQADLRETNFVVSMVALGKVSSPYFKNNPISETRIPQMSNILIPTMSSEQAASVVVNTIYSKKEIVIKPFMMAVSVFFNRLFPSFFEYLMGVK
ncbi:MAG: short-subunit dehydrogenase [Dokdonia sp.]|jgi:short-subunit dehydrogenase